MDVTVVVVCYNSEKVLEGLFASIPDGLDGIDSYEVVVVDNGSKDRSVEVARELMPDATIVDQGRNVGYSTSINAGIRAAQPSRAVFVLNDDIRLRKGSVALLLDALEDETVGITVPRLEDGDGHLLKSLRREPSVSRAFGEAILGGRLARRWRATSEMVDDVAAYETEGVADWASGCAWLISAECLERIGPWDESLFLYAEDAEYALRARDAGLALRYIPTATVTHLVGPAHRDPTRWAMLVWNRYRLFRRRNGVIRSAFFWTALTVGEAIRSLAGRRVHRAGLAALLFPSRRPAVLP